MCRAFGGRVGDCVITVELVQQSGSQRAQIPISAVVIAGWTGRDATAVEEHIAELEELGVKRPTSIPMFYQIASARLTTRDTIEALGTDSSGEVEFVLLQHDRRIWLSVGSDHTDRRVETYDICVSKQMCDKPVASTWWPLDEVQAHWDRLILRSYIGLGSERALYQNGSVAAMLEPATLLARYRQAGGEFTDGMLMFCGTLPAQGGIRPSRHFSFEMDDPVAGRTIRHAYGISCLPLPL